jgi:hypothetical protein
MRQFHVISSDFEHRNLFLHSTYSHTFYRTIRARWVGIKSGSDKHSHTCSSIALGSTDESTNMTLALFLH